MQIGEKSSENYPRPPPAVWFRSRNWSLLLLFNCAVCASSFDADLNANLFSVLLDRLWSSWFRVPSESPSYIKFIYSEKATKFCEIFTLLLSYVVPVKSNMKISQNFVAFSEYKNFNMFCKLFGKKIMLKIWISSAITWPLWATKQNISLVFFRYGISL